MKQSRAPTGRMGLASQSGPVMMQAGQRGDDRLLKLQQENAALKRHNLEQGEKVKQLGVQMQRIRSDLSAASHAGKDAPLAERARAAQVASKDEKIAQLEVRLAQRENEHRRLAQQLTLYKHGAARSDGTTRRAAKRRPASAGAPPATPRTAWAPRTPPAATRTPKNGGGGGAAKGQKPRPAAACNAQQTPPDGVGDTGGADQAAAAAVAAEAASTAMPDGDGDQVAALIRLVREKDAELDELRDKAAAAPLSGAAGATAAIGEGGATGVQETLHVLELRRTVKERTAQLTLLSQRYDHLEVLQRHRA